jgi:tripartite-type tricarboxylate transporter receptor subunit TctC
VANPGSGSSIHLAQELLFERTGMQVTNVNYRGQPPSLLDLAEGRVQFALISQSLALPLIQTGKLRALAVNAAKRRTRSLPNVPTVAEAGHCPRCWCSPGTAWPRRPRTPARHRQAYLSDQFMQTLTQPDTRAKLDAMDAELLAMPGPELDKLIEREFKRWGELIRKRGIKMT